MFDTKLLCLLLSNVCYLVSIGEIDEVLTGGK